MYYKICSIHYNGSTTVYRSYMADYLGKYGLEYKLNKVVLPPVGKLFVFDSLRSTINEFYGNSYAIFEVDVTNPTKPTEKQSLLNCTEKDVDKYWANINDGKYNQYGLGKYKMPKGTVFVDSITLLRKLTKQEILEAERGV